MKKILTLLASASMLAGCGGGGGGGGNNAEVGYLTLSGIRGVSYETASQSGMTDLRGTFRYYPGETITFRLGDIVLAENIPTRKYMTPLDFDPTQYELLEAVSIQNGLSTHTEAEARAAGSNRVVNIMSLIAAFDDDRKQDNGIQISDDALEQLSKVRTDSPIDFNKSPAQFGDQNDLNAPENRLIWAICFEELTPDRCADPVSGRNITNESTAARLLEEELGKITVEIGKSVFITPFTRELAAGDQSLQTLTINVRPDRDIVDMEVTTTDESVLTIHNFDPLAKQVTYFATGPANSQASVIVNIKLENDYRWIRKAMAVQIR